MKALNRRHFLSGVGAAFVWLRSSLSSPKKPLAVADPGETDPRVAELIALSADAKGGVHVQRAAFFGPRGGAKGTLPVSEDEASDLRRALARRDFTLFQERGVFVDGKKFVFLRESEDGTVIHAVRRGEFVTVRKHADRMIVATSVDGMAHNRAVEAVYQFTRRSQGVA